METKKTIGRKKFFKTLGGSILAISSLSVFPISFLAKKSEVNKKEVKVKINPLAVSRKKQGDKNVG